MKQNTRKNKSRSVFSKVLLALILLTALVLQGCLSLPGAVTVRPSGMLLNSHPSEYSEIQELSDVHSNAFESFMWLTFPSAFPKNNAARYSTNTSDESVYLTDIESFSSWRIINAQFWIWVWPEYRFEHKVVRMLDADD